MSNNNCCAICCQVAGQRNGDLLDHLLDGGKEYIRRVILESENYVVFPSVGPLKLGHVILCPKNHYTSFSSLPESFQREYDQVKAKLQNLLRNTFREDIHVFEHRPDVDCSRVPCSVEHAHQHFVPGNIDVVDALYGRFNWEPICPRIASLKEAVRGREYLFYQHPNGNAILAIAEKDGFESQYIRRVFANVIGKGNQWNWREYPSPIVVQETFDLLRSAPAIADQIYQVGRVRKMLR